MAPLQEYEKLISELREEQSQIRADVQQALADNRELLLKEIRQMLEQHLSAPAPVTAPAPARQREKINEDHLMIIGAILACHFGKRVKVRSARRIMLGGGSNVWSQQGRAAVQASHSGLR